MFLFIAFFTLIYSLLHLYFYIKIAAFVFSPVLRVVIWGIILFFIVLPLLSALLSLRYSSWIKISSYFAYCWLAFIFLFTVIALSLDVYRLIIYLCSHLVNKNLNFLVPTNLYLFLVPTLLSIAICIYGFFSAQNIQIKTITITSPKILPNEQLRIVQLSDLHLSPIMNEKRIKSIIELIKQANPDLIVSTGDLIDSSYISNHEELTKLLKTLNPPLGKYAVTGNHEFYAGLPKALAFTEQAGFTMLRQENVKVNNAITLVGVDEPTAIQYHWLSRIPEHEILQALDHKQFIILLKHYPKVNSNSISLFDLQLSGHTHHGQIFPFELLVRLFFPYEAGKLYSLSSGNLYISNGTGTWGPPIRFLAPPEITIFNLVSR